MLLPSQAQLFLEDWPAFLNSSQAVMQAKFPFLQALPAMGPSLKRHGLQESAEECGPINNTGWPHGRSSPGNPRLYKVGQGAASLWVPHPPAA